MFVGLINEFIDNWDSFLINKIELVNCKMDFVFYNFVVL